MELTRQAAEKIKAIKTWAQEDGIRDASDEAKAPHSSESNNAADPETKDPDLVFTVKGVLGAGAKLNKLLKSGDFCNRGLQEDEDDDDNDDDNAYSEEDVQRD